MRKPRRHRYLITLATLAAAGALAPATTAAAGAAPAGTAAGTAAATPWTKISTSTGLGLASAGLLRTSDGKLHVAWARHDGNTFSLRYSTVGPQAKLLGSGAILQNWGAVSFTPRLVPGPSGGIRLVFTGGNGVNGSPFNLGAMYTATATAAGTSWSLFQGSMSHSTLIPVTDGAAAVQSDGTPVAAWAGGGGVTYHQGTSPAIPATSADQAVTVSPGPAIGPSLARNSDGSIWAGWFTESGQSNQGYWAARILPSQAAMAKAPGSGGTSLADNHPLQAAAFTARAGGGLYLAYCVPTQSVPCAHVALWKEGAASASTLPGSATKTASHVAIASAPHGHLWVLWYDTGANKIQVVRTNAAATAFGPVRSVAVPPGTVGMEGVQAEGSRGPLDVVALAQQNTSGFPVAYWDTQLLPKLKLAGSPATVSHTRAATVTFTVTDVGNPVPGAKVTFLGKTATADSKGVAKITVPKGTKTGKHTATAAESGYTPATFTIKVT